MLLREYELVQIFTTTRNLAAYFVLILLGQQHIQHIQACLVCTYSSVYLYYSSLHTSIYVHLVALSTGFECKEEELGGTLTQGIESRSTCTRYVCRFTRKGLSSTISSLCDPSGARRPDMPVSFT